LSPNTSPVVTVIIPCYNAEEFIREAIESVFAQTYENWVMVVVDDGSTDSSLQILREIGVGREDRMRVISGSNRGACHARNLGIDEASTKYIAFLDADDFWGPQKLELQVRHMEANPDAVGVTTAYILCDAAAERRSRTLFFDWSERMLLDWTLLGPSAPALNSTLVVRTRDLRAVGGYNEKLVSFAEDLDLAWALSQLGKLVSIPTVQATIRLSRSQSHRDSDGMTRALAIFYDSISALAPAIALKGRANLHMTRTLRNFFEFPRPATAWASALCAGRQPKGFLTVIIRAMKSRAHRRIRYRVTDSQAVALTQ